jgi:hypothetical protein
VKIHKRYAQKQENEITQQEPNQYPSPNFQIPVDKEKEEGREGKQDKDLVVYVGFYNLNQNKT